MSTPSTRGGVVCSNGGAVVLVTSRVLPVARSPVQLRWDRMARVVILETAAAHRDGELPPVGTRRRPVSGGSVASHTR